MNTFLNRHFPNHQGIAFLHGGNVGFILARRHEVRDGNGYSYEGVNYYKQQGQVNPHEHVDHVSFFGSLRQGYDVSAPHPSRVRKPTSLELAGLAVACQVFIPNDPITKMVSEHVACILNARIIEASEAREAVFMASFEPST